MEKSIFTFIYKPFLIIDFIKLTMSVHSLDEEIQNEEDLIKEEDEMFYVDPVSDTTPKVI